MSSYKSNYKCNGCKHRVAIYSPYLHAFVPSCDSDYANDDTNNCFEPKDNNIIEGKDEIDKMIEERISNHESMQTNND